MAVVVAQLAAVVGLGLWLLFTFICIEHCFHAFNHVDHEFSLLAKLVNTTPEIGVQLAIMIPVTLLLVLISEGIVRKTSTESLFPRVFPVFLGGSLLIVLALTALLFILDMRHLPEFFGRTSKSPYPWFGKLYAPLCGLAACACALYLRYKRRIYIVILAFLSVLGLCQILILFPGDYLLSLGMRSLPPLFPGEGLIALWIGVVVLVSAGIAALARRGTPRTIVALMAATWILVPLPLAWDTTVRCFRCLCAKLIDYDYPLASYVLPFLFIVAWVVIFRVQQVRYRRRKAAEG
jgi:hypothetical protein